MHSHLLFSAVPTHAEQNVEAGPAVTGEQSEHRLRTASPIGSPCGRTKFQVPLGPSAIPTDQILVFNVEATSGGLIFTAPVLLAMRTVGLERFPTIVKELSRSRPCRGRGAIDPRAFGNR